ncbi:hypothetical protein D7209_10215 [Burkholderia cepacia]|nr:hypothetical protein [Burkholderia cepacia]MBB0079634.1 hypothetical protein [Burkholderia cepacia]MBB0110959.1 hypothetical protein [Burkholderia cepacia]MBB0120131.1 hypothetical protein [Burkholderia cepacia]MBB0148710.1 hypothetical protein [Burkholderia cepacia]
MEPPVIVAPELASEFSVAVPDAERDVNFPELGVAAPTGAPSIEPPMIAGFEIALLRSTALRTWPGVNCANAGAAANARAANTMPIAWKRRS